VRAKTEHEAHARLWHALQLHLDFPQVRDALETRISIFRGDLTDARFGLDDTEYTRLAGTTESVIHCAARSTANPKKSCLNVNLRGTLEVAQLARRAHDAHGLRRFSQVSTVAVAGHRSHEIVSEDTSIDWNRSITILRAHKKILRAHGARAAPGRAAHCLSSQHCAGRQPPRRNNAIRYGSRIRFSRRTPVLPFRPSDRIDIVPVDYVAESVSRCIRS